MIIGYTSGCYDLFHVGHLRLLQAARKLCDFLIVGVSTDILVKSYKKPPAIPFNERLEIIKGLSCVDLAVSQNSLDKGVAWGKLDFDILFIGDDWYGSESWEVYEKELPIPIVYLPYTKGVSSTILKEKLHGVQRLF